MKNIIGKTIKWYRERLEMNQTEFGRIYGVERVPVMNWEKGKSRPPVKLIEILMEISYHKGFGDATFPVSNSLLPK